MEQTERRRRPKEMENDQHTKVKKGGAWVFVAAKILSVPFLLFLSLVVGLMIGYGVIGKSPVSEVFDFKTYKHIYDLIFSTT
ncbi:DNA-directed RNA polymerase subunit beta [Brevibacillus massiliensis]|uniref:DNA-directed RNA polymerase subunit beta n=1 Tax=Brevibacillus massiliensis TaxID=1118054 RepID=UPI0002D37759|nr:DNA-directed RNA polymerase subunit beta [Brevibacillus massiliensis]